MRVDRSELTVIKVIQPAWLARAIHLHTKSHGLVWTPDCQPAGWVWGHDYTPNEARYILTGSWESFESAADIKMTGNGSADNSADRG